MVNEDTNDFWLEIEREIEEELEACQRAGIALIMTAVLAPALKKNLSAALMQMMKKKVIK